MADSLLNKGSNVVLYKQLADVLKQQFLESELAAGERIPTEFELSEKFGVSRGTVRQALDLLENEGLIERKPGLGTFLCRTLLPDRPIPGNQRHIGVIVPHFQDQLSLTLLAGVESIAKNRGYQVVFNQTNENLEEEKNDIRRMLENHVAGFVIFPISNLEYDPTIWELHQNKVPFVLVDRFFTDLNCDYVVADNLRGGYQATEHLILLGHKEIGFVYHPQADFRTTSVHDRYQGYRKALEEYGIEFKSDWLIPIDESYSDVLHEDQIQHYVASLTQRKWPKAVVTVNDITAIRLVASASQLGIRIPEDLAVVGFDNLRIASQIQYPLTTVNQERTELGVRATYLLIDRIEGRAGKPEHIVVPTSLVIRESCGARKRLAQNHTI